MHKHSIALALSFSLLRVLDVSAAEKTGEFNLDLTELKLNVTMETPKLDTVKDELSGDTHYEYRGRTANGLSITVLVEPAPAGKSGHLACRPAGYEKAKTQEQTDRSSYKTGTTPNYTSVEYVMTSKGAKTSTKIAYLELYAQAASSCVEVHVSKSPFGAGDRAVLDRIKKTFVVK